jgi:hypothetical protein
MSPSALEAAMAHFSDRVVSFNKLIIAAAVAYAGAVGFAHANPYSDDIKWIDKAEQAAMATCNQMDMRHSTAAPGYVYSQLQAIVVLNAQVDSFAGTGKLDPIVDANRPQWLQK